MKKVCGIAVMLLALAACNKIENNKAEGGIPFSASISLGHNEASKALTEDGSTIVATWAKGEKVALIHNGVSDEMTVSSVEAGVATITGTITGSPTTGDAVTVIYPSTAADGVTGEIKADLLENQDGTLTGTDGASIAEKYDVRKGTGTLMVGAKASLNGNVSLTNQFAIFKFTVKNADGSATLDVNLFTVTIDAQDYVITPASATSTFYVALPAVSDQNVSFTATASGSKTYVASKANVTFTAGKYYQSVIKMTKQPRTIDLSSVTADVIAEDGDTLTGKLNGFHNYNVLIVDGATVTLASVYIHTCASNIGISCEGDATIILKDRTLNTVRGEENRPGIYIPQSKTLIIKGENENGTLYVYGGMYGAGIGGGKDLICGNIIISGGKVHASGGDDGAGIGSGKKSSCGNITITGGEVHAWGDEGGAGIGSSNKSSCGDITITGGEVYADGHTGSAGIGSGRESSCGNIIISGGTVEATGGLYSAGIGSGQHNSTCGNITIESTVTKVTAIKGIGSNGNVPYFSIGAGSNSTCGTITIGGVVTGSINESPYTYYGI